MWLLRPVPALPPGGAWATPPRTTTDPAGGARGEDGPRATVVRKGGVRMWIPETFGEAFPLVILSLVCWGSWSNTAKEANRLAVPFAHFYSDWCLGGFATALLAWVTLGDAEVAAESGVIPTTDVGRYRVLSAFAAGAIFNVANALLVVGINLAGLSVAFPMGIGTALVLGTVLTYFVDSGNRPNRPQLLFGGVALGFIAVVAIAAADHFLRKARAQTYDGERSSLLDGQDGGGGRRRREGSVPLVNGDDEESSGAERARFTVPGSSGGEEVPARKPPPVPAAVGGEGSRPSALASAGVCLGAGLLMSCWAPLSSYSMNNNTPAEDGLNPYASFMLYMTAVLVTSLKPSPLAIFLVQSPLDASQRTTPAVYYELSAAQHVLGWAGGMIWAIGTLSNLVSGNTVGAALAYATGQSAPMVATGWGVFYYREFRGAPAAAWYCLGGMVMLYAGAIAMIALSSRG